jgi:predicted RND superfamily exporter protein
MFHGWLTRIAERAMARPWRFIAAMTVFTLLAAPGLTRLKFRTDGHALMPPDHPVVRFDAEVRRDFQLRDPIVVLIETSHPDGIYNLATLRRVAELSEVLAGIDGIGKEQVTSLATERRDRFFPGTLTFRPFLDPLPDTPLLMSLLKSDVQATPNLTGTLISRDGRATSILVGAPAAFDPQGRITFDRAALYRQIVQVTRRFETPADRIVVAGAPAAESLLGLHILEDLRLLIPLALVLIALACWWGCRRVWTLLVVLPKMAAALLWTFGLMGWLGVPVYLTTAVLPVILITAFLADEIHLLWHYQQLLAERPAGEPYLSTLKRATAEMSRPITLASLTTAAGFFSFLSSSIIPIWAFGLFAGLAILFCLLWTFTVVPATLALLGPERVARRGRSLADGQRLARALSPLLDHRAATLAVLGLLTLALGLGIGRLKVQDSWIDGFAPGSPFRRATEEVNARLYGSHLLLAQVHFTPPPERVPRVRRRSGPLLAPENLRALGALEDFIRRQPGVGGVEGPYSQFTTVAYFWLGRQPGGRAVPDDLERVDQVYRLFDRNRGEFHRHQVIDEALDRGIVTIFLKAANYQETGRLMRAIRGYERQHLAPLWARVDFAGDVAVSQAMIPQIVRSQIWSLVLALAGSFLVICLLHRSIADGFWAVLPANVAVVWIFGAMGWLGIPLGVATSMFCAITLGIGADYGVHLLERFRHAQAAGSPDPQRVALAEAGPAIIIDCVAIALGFALLAFSEVPADARLGVLVAAALLASCVLTLTGLALLLPTERRQRAHGAQPAAAPRSEAAGSL